MLSPDRCYGLEKLIKYTLESCPQGPSMPGGKNLIYLHTKAGVSPWHPGSWDTMQPSAGGTRRAESGSMQGPCLHLVAWSFQVMSASITTQPHSFDAG